MPLNPNMALPVDIVLTAGQSNMSGTPGGSASPPSTTAGLVWEWRDATAPTFIQLEDPTTTENPYKAQVGSCLPTFSNTFVSASERSLVVVRAARGGTALLAANSINPPLGNGHWDVGGNCFTASVTRLNNAIADVIAEGHTVGHVFVIWSQGGRDAQGGQDLELYEAANAALVDRWRDAIGISTIQVFMEELSSILGGEGDLADEIALIREAENNAVAYTDGLHMAFNEGKDYVNRPGWMRTDDKIHYTQVGLNYMGLKMATYAAEYYGWTVPEEPPVTPSGTTSQTARRLLAKSPLPPLPRNFPAGVTTWTVPFGITSVKIECEGSGGRGGNGVVGLKGGAGGGGAYATVTESVTAGAQYEITVGAGSSTTFTQVKRLSDDVVICRADYGKQGTDGNPAVDGAGGLASNSIGTTTTSGQNGGVSGIDNGGNGAAPLGGAGGVGPGNVPGTYPGGGGAGAIAGGAQLGGQGANGLVRLTIP